MEYSFRGIQQPHQPFQHIEDWTLYVPCTNRDSIIEYIYRLYCFDSYLYITDIFPVMYEKKDDCFKRFTSHDGYSVNFRALMTKCLYIFVDEILRRDNRSVMVVSGSYAPDEKPQGESRKLKLYRYIFIPRLKELGLCYIDLAELNALLLYGASSPLHTNKIRENYIKFKHIQNR